MPSARKYSRKREAIYNAICSSHSHPAAGTIYAQLKPEFPDLSLGTVYRNLSLFVNEGTIRCVCVVDGNERFDGDTSDHPHFVCNCCGCVSDLADDRLLMDTAAVESRNGITVSRIDLVFYGVCADCTNRT